MTQGGLPQDGWATSARAFFFPFPFFLLLIPWDDFGDQESWVINSAQRLINMQGDVFLGSVLVP